MNSQAAQLKQLRKALGSRAELYGVRFDEVALDKLCEYYALLLTWNPRLHLVAPCSSEEFATRHVLESLLLSPHLPQEARIADVGSGAGLPIVPNLILRPDIRVTLVESSQKKAVFLREALRLVKPNEPARVVAERFENVATLEVEIITCRALDRFSEMFATLLHWAPPRCSLLLFGGPDLQQQIEATTLMFSATRIPETERRFLFIIEKS